MSDSIEAVKASLALAFGGILFILVGRELADTRSMEPMMIDIELWGIIYIVAAIILAILVVYAFVLSILD